MFGLDLPMWVLVTIAVLAVAAVLLSVGSLMGHAIGEPDPQNCEASARWFIELQLSPAQVDPRATEYSLEGDDVFHACVYATIDGIPGKHGLRGVEVTFDVSQAPYAPPTSRKVLTGADGIATLQVTTLITGRAIVTAAATISGATQWVSSPVYELEPGRLPGVPSLELTY